MSNQTEMKKLIAQDFSYIDDLEIRANVEQLQAEMIRLQAAGFVGVGDELWSMAARNLGNADGRYDGIFTCQHCGKLYHQDYSTALGNGDFCGMECEEAQETCGKS